LESSAKCAFHATIGLMARFIGLFLSVESSESSFHILIVTFLGIGGCEKNNNTPYFRKVYVYMRILLSVLSIPLNRSKKQGYTKRVFVESTKKVLSKCFQVLSSAFHKMKDRFHFRLWKSANVFTFGG